MLNMLAHMTKAEKEKVAQDLNDYTKNCKVDEEATWTAIKKYSLNAGSVIHFNMLKCEVLSSIGRPIYPLSPEDYRDICNQKTEEESRKKLCEILAKKDKEYKMEQEPEMEIVKEADGDPKNEQLLGNRLRSIIERIERLEEEKAALASDIKEIYAEAKSVGFDTKTMRAIIRLRKMNAADRDEQEFLLDEYKKLLGI